MLLIFHLTFAPLNVRHFGGGRPPPPPYRDGPDRFPTYQQQQQQGGQIGAGAGGHKAAGKDGRDGGAGGEAGFDDDDDIFEQKGYQGATPYPGKLCLRCNHTDGDFPPLLLQQISTTVPKRTVRWWPSTSPRASPTALPAPTPLNTSPLSPPSGCPGTRATRQET